jgi:Ca-activated chloride channel family protein
LDTRTGNGPNVTIYTAQPAPIFALGSPSSMDASTRSLPEVSAELKQVTDAIIGTGGRMSRATGNVSQGVGGDNGGGAATSRRRGVILMSPPMVSRDAVFHGSIMGGTGTGAITTATEALPADPTVVTEGDEPAAIAAEAPPLAAEVAEVSLAARATPRAPTPAAQNPFSTFSLNVSDASFRLAAEALRKNRWPERATLRTEEFVNALTYNDPPPAAGHALALAQEQARDPFGHSRNLLRLSLQTASTGRNPRQPLNLTVLLDTSGSMERADRQAVVAEALRALAGNIHDDDTVGLLGFARTPDLRFQERGAKARAKLLAQIGNITPEGGTNLERALRDAFTQNSTASVAGAQNRVVLLTDGAANLGDANPDSLAALIAKNKKHGITLDCFGVGFDGYNDAMLETLARAANGRYAYLNNAAEAREDFARKLAGALQVAAQNVKVQVEFNPARVVSWRLLGYEKHLLTKEQFRDNTVLAAQLGAAESGTAVYAVEINAKGFGGVGVVRARFQDPRTGEYHERDWAIPYDPATPPLDKAPPGIQLAAVAALSAEKFDGSEEARLVPWKSLADILRTANNALGLFPANLRLLQMLDQAHRLE